MKKLFVVIILLVSVSGYSQLTVEKIMRDSKWIGTSPSALPGRTTAGLTFNGTRKKQPVILPINMSRVGCTVQNHLQRKAGCKCSNNAAHNKSYTQLAYAYKGDIYLVDVLLNKTTRITQTADYESNLRLC